MWTAYLEELLGDTFQEPVEVVINDFNSTLADRFPQVIQSALLYLTALLSGGWLWLLALGLRNVYLTISRSVDNFLRSGRRAAHQISKIADRKETIARLHVQHSSLHKKLVQEQDINRELRRELDGLYNLWGRHGG
ncbi:MAG: hypothetical protein HC902_11475 [Calothrix sp. SM1_5_4]|nr:hypothetical protein [Calothrix sp. SM1_5_4]